MIGSNLVARLAEDSFDVYLLVRTNSNLIRLDAVRNKVKLLYGDLTDSEAVSAAVKVSQPEIVFHLASTLWVKQQVVSNETHFRVNVLGTLHLLRILAERCPAAKIVFMGSSSVYGSGSCLKEDSPLKPSTVYSSSKASASIVLQTFAEFHNLRTVELRLFMPYGMWEHPSRLIPHTILSAMEGKDVLVSLGTQTRDLVYIDDIVEALVCSALQELPVGSVLNLGSGVGLSVREIVERILHLMGDPVKPCFGTIPMRPDEMMENSSDISLLRSRLAWSPRTSVDEGLRKTIAWFKENRDVALKVS